MPKFNSLISLGTAKGALAGLVAGSVATVAVQRHMGSSESSNDPQRTEMREDQKKKMSFEVQQQSEELEEKKRDIEIRELSVAKKWGEVGEKEEALRQMQQAMTETQGVAAGVVPVETVQQVAQAKGQADAQPEEPKADVVPMNNASRRLAVFAGGGNKENAGGGNKKNVGGGNKEKPTTKKNDDSKQPVAFGSSDDVVTIEKGGAVSDAEAEHLREEVKNLRRRLADDASKEKRLRRWEDRLREQERALSEKLWKRNMQSKTADPLSEKAFGGGGDPFDKGPDSKKVSSSALAGGKTQNPTSEKDDPISKMEKDEVKSYTKKEVVDLLENIDSKDLEKIIGKSVESKDKLEEMVFQLKEEMLMSLNGQPEDVSGYSIDQALKTVDRSKIEKNIKVLNDHIPSTKGIKTVGTLNSLVTTIRTKMTPKSISPETYAKILIKSADEVAKRLKYLPAEKKDVIEREKTRLQDILERRARLRKNVDKILGKEPKPATINEGFQILNDAKAKAQNLVKVLYEDGKGGLLSGFKKVNNDWECVKASSQKLYPANAVVPPPPSFATDVTIKDDGISEVGWVDDLRAVDEEFKDQDDKNSEAYDNALKPLRVIGSEKAKYNTKIKKIDEENSELRKKKRKVSAEEAAGLDKKIRENSDERRALMAKVRHLGDEERKLKSSVVSLQKKWKDYRLKAYGDSKKKLLVIQQGWLTRGSIKDKGKVDLNVQKAQEELNKEREQKTKSDIRRLELLGAAPAANSGVALTHQQKEDRRQFIADVRRCERNFAALKERYETAVFQKKAVESIEVQKMPSNRYHVTLLELSVLGLQQVYDALMAFAPDIEELTIERFDKESTDTPFLNLAKLCRRLTGLKKFSIKGNFKKSETDDVTTIAFFEKLQATPIKGDFDTVGLSPGGEERFFDVMSLIPNCETFEMHNTDIDGNPNDTGISLLRADRIYAVVEPCKEACLPNIEVATNIEFFYYLMHSETNIKKHLKLYTASFGSMMRKAGFPEALYRLFKSGKATVEWLGNVDNGKMKFYTSQDSRDARDTLPVPENDMDTVDKIRAIVKGQKIGGKSFEDWVLGPNFSDNFLKNPEVYLKMSGTHSEVFKRMLIKYNEEELNPLYFACSSLEAFKKREQAVNIEGVKLNNPLSGILKKYPVLNSSFDGVTFSGLKEVDGSTLRNNILPALLNLVLRQHINGENHILLAVEDAMVDVKTHENESGTKMTEKIFHNMYSWYFPSITNSLWKKEDFAISANSKTFAGLSDEQKDDLKLKMMEASVTLSKGFAGLGYSTFSCNLDPAIGRECLKKIDSKSTFYWNFFLQRMQTGYMTVATDAPSNERELFEIFSTVAGAQPTYEKMFKAYENMFAVDKKLRPLKNAAYELEKKIKESNASNEQDQKALLRKKKEIEDKTKELEKYRKEIDGYAKSLEPVRDFLEDKLQYVKQIVKEINSGAGKKKPAVNAQQTTNTNAPTNVNPTGTPTNTNLVPKKSANNLFSNNSSSADVAAWIKGGKKIKYKEAGKANILWDVLPATHAIRLATAGIVSPAGIAPDIKAVEKAVNAGFLKVEHNGIDYYVILTVQEVVP